MKRIFILSITMLLFLSYGFSQEAQDSTLVVVQGQEDEVAYNKGIEFFKAGKYEASIKKFTEAIFYNNNFEKAFLNRGYAKMRLKQYGEAIIDLDSTIAKNDSLALSYYIKGRCYDAMKNKEKAIENYFIAEKKGCDRANLFYFIGVNKFYDEKYDNAVSYFTKAIGKDSKHAFAYNDRGSAKRKLKDIKGAIKDYQQAVVINKKLAVAYDNLSVVKAMDKDTVGSIEASNKAIEIKSDFYIAYNNRGSIYFYQKKYDKAIADFNKAIEYNKDYAYAYNNLGNVKHKQKDYKGALDAFNKAIVIDVNYGAAYLNRATTKEMLRDERGACADWNKAVELGIEQAKQFVGGCE